jgi:hypothetical protein
MTASSTIVSLANRALLGIGARDTIASLTENSTEANAVNVFYQSTFEQLARTARWGCLRKQATLSLLAAAQGTPENPTGSTLSLPPVGWLYQYASPSDNLFIRGILPYLPSATGVNPTTVNNSAPTWLPNSGQISFRVEYSTDAAGNPIETILTNESQAIGVYTVNNSNPFIFDSLFEQAIVSALSAFLVPALSLNMPLMGAMMKNAEVCIAAARVADGNETPVSQDHVPDWIRARNIGGSLSWNSGTGYNGGYENMYWPMSAGGAGIS